MPSSALTTKQAADATGIPRRTILFAIQSGDLRAEKHGDGLTSAWAINPDDLDAWVAQRQSA